MTKHGETADVRLDIDAHASVFIKAVSRLDNAATAQLDQVDFDRRLRELVRLRASQINGCSYCVDLHTTDGRTAGEMAQRLTAVPVWRESVLFDQRERAALAFTESVTRLSETSSRAWPVITEQPTASRS